MAPRQAFAVGPQHGHHFDLYLLALAGMGRDRDSCRRRPRLLEMARAGEGRGLEVRYRALAHIPAVHLDDVIEGGAEIAEGPANLSHHLIGLGDDFSRMEE